MRSAGALAGFARAEQQAMWLRSAGALAGFARAEQQALWLRSPVTA